MDIKDLFMRLLDEQKWREQKAQGMSSGLGSLPYSFQERMNLQYPSFMDQLEKDKRYNQKYQERQIEGQPDFFMERLLLNEAMKMKQQNSQHFLRQML